MRNLSLSCFTRAHLPTANISATAVDLDASTIYVADDRSSARAGIISIRKAEAVGDKFEISDPISEFESSSPHVCEHAAPVVSLHVSPETRSLILITRSGEIAVLSLEDCVLPSFEIEGSVGEGILAAAWNPDSSLLVLVTGDDKLILMTSTFDVLSESALHHTDFGEDAPMNLGWGSKQTQFHGSIGKESALATAPTTVGSSPDDDTLPRISWRGDGAFFAVSSLSKSTSDEDINHRIIRVYSHTGALQSTSEATPGLEHPLAWRPSGGLIASAQRFGLFVGAGIGKEGRHDIVFFEKNGLRRGEFALNRKGHEKLPERASDVGSVGPWGYRIKEVSWSLASDVLAIWFQDAEGDVVQLWTCGNYHWYLKQEILAPWTAANRPGRFTSVTWHPENNLHLTLTTSTEVMQRTYMWDTYASLRKPPEDSGCVCVIDSSSLLLTAFRAQNVPPPMCSHALSLSSDALQSADRPSLVPVHVSFSGSADAFAVLWESGYFEIWHLGSRLEPRTGTSHLSPTYLWSSSIGHDVVCRQIVLLDGGSVAVLGQERCSSDSVYVVESGSKNVSPLVLPSVNGILTAAGPLPVWEARDGELLNANFSKESLQHVGRLPEFCPFLIWGELPAVNSVFVGHASSGNLYIVCPSLNATARKLASNATSFTIASDLVIFTTSDHEVVFTPLATITTQDNGSMAVDRRKVERGSRIVTAVPSAMCLVLQMPRGNLETINPRPLVLKKVNQDLAAGRYRDAFLACRKHRIDLSLLVSHDQATFLRKIPDFVEQIDLVDYLNLFLSSISKGALPSDIINAVCDGVRVELEEKDMMKYINTILTSHVVKIPPDHEAGLAVLSRFREEVAPNLVEEAVKYIIFLVDADRLFDTALGMYDISLVLMVAQHAQKDPREYLSFLRELKTMSTPYQHFRIDDHLGRYEKALHNLSMAGHEHVSEAMEYMERYRLYKIALGIWKGTGYYLEVLDRYGDWLFERRDFIRAALVFREASKLFKAMEAYEKALEWQDLFALALHPDIQISHEQTISIGYRVADELVSRKRYQEASRVLLDYCDDTGPAVSALVKGNLFSEAERVIMLKNSPHLLVEVLHPAAFESCAQITEDLAELKEQFRKQLSRMRELRVLKVEGHDSFYNLNDGNAHDIDVMSDVSTPETAFTRYTAPSTTMTKQSKRSSRSKRKMERKVGSGRKGTVDEEEYLLNSLTKLVAKFNARQDDFTMIKRHLIKLTPEHRAEGVKLQKEMDHLEMELRDGLDEIWPSENVQTEETLSWRGRMDKAEMASRIDPFDRVPKPVIISIQHAELELF